MRLIILLTVFLTVFIAAGDADDNRVTGSSKQNTVKKKDEPGLVLIKAYQCLDCHTLDGAGAKDGMPLDRLKLPKRFVVDHMLDPEASVERNPFPFNSEPNMMPSHQLTRTEAELMARYLFKRQPKDPPKPKTKTKKTTTSKPPTTSKPK